MSILYVLLLENEKYYVGRTSDFDKRLIEHSSGNGAEWTSLHKVIKPVEIIKNCQPQDEDAMTVTYMSKYGIENVRGGTFCNVVLSPKTIKILKNMISTQNLTCFKCNEKGHYANECPTKKSINSVICYKCNEKGHYSNDCVNQKNIASIMCYKCNEKGHYAINCPEIKKVEKDVARNLTEITTEITPEITTEITPEIPKETPATKTYPKIMGTIALKSHHKKWLCFDSLKKESIINANRDIIGEFEKFTVIYAENDEIKLFCPKHNTYLAAKDNGEVYQTAESDKQDVLWKIEPVSINIKTNKIEKLGFLHAKNKRYLCAERPNFFGYGKVVANREFCKSFETWELAYLQ